MRRTDDRRHNRTGLGLWCLGLALAGAFPSAVQAGPTAQDLCLDQTIRKTAAKAIEIWAQNYPFARVIIGSDGKFGHVTEPAVAAIGHNYVVCRASYRLVRIGKGISAYNVAIDRFDFRVTANSEGYQITLEDLPPGLAGSDITSRELLARFTVNDRPYVEVLEQNRDRIELRNK